jgi:hypothetical protein
MVLPVSDCEWTELTPGSPPSLLHSLLLDAYDFGHSTGKAFARHRPSRQKQAFNSSTDQAGSGGRLWAFALVGAVAVFVVAAITLWNGPASKYDISSRVIAVTKIGEASAITKFVQIFDPPPNIQVGLVLLTASDNAQFLGLASNFHFCPWLENDVGFYHLFDNGWLPIIFVAPRQMNEMHDVSCRSVAVIDYSNMAENTVS